MRTIHQAPEIKLWVLRQLEIIAEQSRLERQILSVKCGLRWNPRKMARSMERSRCRRLSLSSVSRDEVAAIALMLSGSSLAAMTFETAIRSKQYAIRNTEAKRCQSPKNN